VSPLNVTSPWPLEGGYMEQVYDTFTTLPHVVY
jgi:hypothetical protein